MGSPAPGSDIDTPFTWPQRWPSRPELNLLPGVQKFRREWRSLAFASAFICFLFPLPFRRQLQIENLRSLPQERTLLWTSIKTLEHQCLLTTLKKRNTPGEKEKTKKNHIYLYIYIHVFIYVYTIFCLPKLLPTRSSGKVLVVLARCSMPGVSPSSGWPGKAEWPIRYCSSLH